MTSGFLVRTLGKMSVDFSLTEEVKMKLLDPNDLTFVGFLHEFQWAPGHGPEEGIKMLEASSPCPPLPLLPLFPSLPFQVMLRELTSPVMQVEPRRKEPERRGLIAYEIQERRGSPQAAAAAGVRQPPLRLAESMMGVHIDPADEDDEEERGHRDVARLSEWDGERLIVYLARDGQLHAIQVGKFKFF